MKKLLKNKRLLVTFLAGILLMSATLTSGTWAWFTDRATAEGLNADFEMAKINVNLDNDTLEATVFDFYPGDLNTVTLQEALETEFNAYWEAPDDEEPEERDIRQANGYTAFWNVMHTSFGGNVETPLNLIENPWIERGFETRHYNLTPSSIIEVKYSFKINATDTTIPVYFRVPAFNLELEQGDFDLAFIQSAQATIGTQTIPLGRAVTVSNDTDIDGDIWYYSPEPIFVTQSASPIIVNISVFVYISGKHNDDELQKATFNFEGTVNDEDEKMVVVELIQATNNAVYLVDGWRAAAALTRSVLNEDENKYENVSFFIPYVTPTP